MTDILQNVPQTFTTINSDYVNQYCFLGMAFRLGGFDEVKSLLTKTGNYTQQPTFHMQPYPKVAYNRDISSEIQSKIERLNWLAEQMNAFAKQAPQDMDEDEFRELYTALDTTVYKPGNLPEKKLSLTGNEVAKVQIELEDIMSLVDKLWVSGKKNFLHQLSQEKNLSKSIFNLLLSKADSVVLGNLCLNGEIAWDLLEKLVKKLLWVVQWTEKVVLIHVPRYDEDDEGGYEEQLALEEGQQWDCSTEAPIVSELLLEYIDSYLASLFKNQNLTSEHIEALITPEKAKNHNALTTLASHQQTPSWILEEIYARYGKNGYEQIILNHPNTSQDLKTKIEGVIQQKEEKDKKDASVQAIIEKHPGLDIRQILQYYENKQDEITAKIIAEYIYQDNLWHFRYGAKWDYENFGVKLQLIQKYNLWKDCTVRILYDMIGDAIVKTGEYSDIQELAKKYDVIIGPEQIKTLCKEIIEESTHWCNPSILHMRHVYKFAESISLELSPEYQKFYAEQLINEINKRRPHDYSDEKNLLYNCIDDALALMQTHRDIFSEYEKQAFVMILDKKCWNAYNIFDLVLKLELSDKFLHDIGLSKFKECFRHDHKRGKELISKFTITEEEIIDLMVNNDRSFAERNGGYYSPELSLDAYGIAKEKVIPFLMGKIKEKIIEYIRRKDYEDAQTIITKYNLASNPDFKEQVDVLNTLTKK